jgi:hypothetical protein
MTLNNQFDEEKLFEELEGEESEHVEATDDDIVKKYDAGQARIVIQRNDFLIPNILQMVDSKDILDISPPYQRRKRWDNKKRSHLVESLLMNIPIPPIFLYERDLAKYEVMDGQQRLDTIRAFFKNEFALTDLKKWPELNGRHYFDLPGRIQAGLSRRGLAAVIILTESGETPEKALEIRQYVFERLNTGGEKLNPQEIRNCIYAGPFNDMIRDLARSDLFTKAWGIPPKEPDEPRKVSRELENNRYYSTMADCQIVLRYFALSDLTKFRGSMKHTLDNCMLLMQNIPPNIRDSLSKEFLNSLDIAIRVYGDQLFRLPNRAGELRRQRSVPLLDAVLLGIRNLGQNASLLPNHSEAILKGTKDLLMKKETYEILVARGNTKREIERRIELMTNMYRSVLEG